MEKVFSTLLLLETTVCNLSIIMYYMSSFFTNAVQFADQYLELTTSLPDNHNIYGLGEHVTPNLKLRLNKALWIVDT